MRIRWFIGGTDTNVGKTVVSTGLAFGLARRGLRVAALKPIETGVSGRPVDADNLAAASGTPLADHPAWVRRALPASPYACALEGEAPCSISGVAPAIQELERNYDALLVEGAGGLLVPTSEGETIADLIRQLETPLILVAPNRLGVLSHVLCAVVAARTWALRVGAVVLVDPTELDVSARTNQLVLSKTVPCPVLRIPWLEALSFEASADAVERAGLLDLVARG